MPEPDTPLPDGRAKLPAPPVRVVVIHMYTSFRERLVDHLAEDATLNVVFATSFAKSVLARLPDLQADIVVYAPSFEEMPQFPTLRQLRAALPSAGIILVTTFDEAPYRTSAAEAGADAQVYTLSVVTDLLPAIHRLVRRHAP